jgi:hypothetical protein
MLKKAQSYIGVKKKIKKLIKLRKKKSKNRTVKKNLLNRLKF